MDVAVPELPRHERVGVRELCSVVAAASDQGGSSVQRGNRWLRGKLQVSRSTVQRYVKKAERAGVLEVGRQRDPDNPGRHLANTYHPRPRPGSRCAELVAVRVARARGAAARAPRHRGRVTDPPERVAPEWICPEAGCGWKGAAGPCQATHEDRGP